MRRTAREARRLEPWWLGALGRSGMRGDDVFERDCRYRIRGTAVTIDESAKTYYLRHLCCCRLNAVDFWEEVLPRHCNHCPVPTAERVLEHVTVYIPRSGPGVTSICLCGKRLAEDLSCSVCHARQPRGVSRK